MKQFLILLAFTLLLLAGGCARVEVESIDSEIAAFFGTRSGSPLEDTVWEYSTGEEFNQYILFQDGQISFFYGRVEDGELHRWSEFFTAPYELRNGRIYTSLSYRRYGETEHTQKASVARMDGGFSLYLDDAHYTFFGPYAESLEWQWMTITVTIESFPWE